MESLYARSGCGKRAELTARWRGDYRRRATKRSVFSRTRPEASCRWRLRRWVWVWPPYRDCPSRCSLDSSHHWERDKLCKAQLFRFFNPSKPQKCPHLLWLRFSSCAVYPRWQTTTSVKDVLMGDKHNNISHDMMINKIKGSRSETKVKMDTCDSFYRKIRKYFLFSRHVFQAGYW